MASRRGTARPDAVDLILDQWARHDPELDPSAMAVFGRLHRCFLRYQSQLTPVFERYGISMAAFDVLAALRRSGEPYRQTMRDLGGVTLVTAGGLTQRVDRLEASGLVRRERDAVDGRVVHAQLTPSGLDLVDQVTRAHFANEREMLAGLDEAEQRRLARLLRRLEQSLDEAAVRASE
ncbi:Transcriptional regulator, MarR family [Pseudonocardia sp. Ae406_Ps2]|uniref:MarR family winged helix-turn-helix transcriptional regulator n=1 Tax=unclassified Pseudonocardia TaxID=2619320 RepID=UPI0002FCCE0C|nr:MULTISPECIES: MarR family transcriptional regulator [unclassified Pseudonocardia]OLL98531.1 Transcriptional regulator, MarR family [Pseudonocardia sp. Ae331_Ps2]OLM03741.1 Transcriptional regulator, MarR family [Pseudonocardia sp. Ae406_Ps2]OLM11402.1 Transcriptional regulator, MarR family [Pseudonocardia sp. Ae505_Ps2]OLM25300.1 Transcriptional regulator, MarR family [Pseudonocardia sp. Ae706_Ps2]OLM34508.1 Transcriptional regulator, MarR family [Pseudonocardia sp. Ae717_Ps2]